LKPLEIKIIHQDKVELEDGIDAEEKDLEIKKSVENVRKVLQTKRIREKGAAYIINVFFSIYRSVKNFNIFFYTDIN